jgi:hypothetical protein
MVGGVDHCFSEACDDDLSADGGWDSPFVGNGFRGTDIAIWQDSGAYVATTFGLICCWTDRI